MLTTREATAYAALYQLAELLRSRDPDDWLLDPIEQAVAALRVGGRVMPRASSRPPRTHPLELGLTLSHRLLSPRSDDVCPDGFDCPPAARRLGFEPLSLSCAPSAGHGGRVTARPGAARERLRTLGQSPALPPMTWDPTPEQRARHEARQLAARRMRAQGKSYEQIAEALSSGPDAYCLLGDAYSLAHPEKSPQQIMAWKSKHAMTAAEDVRWNVWCERFHPEYLLDHDEESA